MPNWVFNNLMIQDSNPETVHLIKDQLNRPFERTYQHNWNVQTQQFEPKTVKYNNPIFSFWNIKAPTDIEAYEKQTDYSSPTPYSGNDWYSFNNREWGTKWDVAVPDEGGDSDTCMTDFKADGVDNWVGYRFDTAWAPPVQAMLHLSNQYPTAVLTLTWEEEQGFGGEIEFVAGEVTSDMSYESRCRDCDEYDCLEYCDDCGENICNKCHYMGEVDLEAVAECDTHKVFLTPEFVPDYRLEKLK
jgi:hypothetical protein